MRLGISYLPDEEVKKDLIHLFCFYFFVLFTLHTLKAASNMRHEYSS